MAIVAILTFIGVLLVITWVAQNQLQQWSLDRMRLSIEKQATALSYFFQERRQDLITLRKSPVLQNYFTNRDLGMSMRYGLSTSLLQISELIEEIRSTKKIGDLPIYLHLAVYDEYGKLLAESGEYRESKDVRAIDAPSGGAVEIRVVPNGDDFELMLVSELPYRNGQAGTLVARLDHRSAVTSLTASDSMHSSTGFVVGYGSTPLRISNAKEATLDKQARKDLAALLEKESTSLRTGKISQETFGVYTSVPNTPFWLVGLYPLGDTLGILPSRGFFYALVLVALSILGGAAVLIHANNKNIVLQVRLEEWKRQQSLLNAENAKLEKEVERRIESERLLYQQANFDQLTGLPNRALAIDRLSQAIARADNKGTNVLLVFADVDRFKQINDSLGHTAGDRLLVQVAERLTKDFKASDTVARFGGDEFVLIFPDIPDVEAVQKLADRILMKFSESFQLDGHDFQMTTSLGVTVYPRDGVDAMSMLKNADTALYEAKNAGRNTFCHFTASMNEQMTERMLMESKLRQAIAQDELSLAYQPQVNLDTGEIVAFEALLRWHNPELGQVPPSKFIPLAEESSLIEELGAWALNRACHEAQAWQQLSPVRISVNLSSRQLRCGNRFFATLTEALRDSGLNPSRLELEVTETALLEDLPEITRIMQEIDRLGVRLALDDFGTGYSALSYLKHLPFDVLKIDRSFVNDCTSEQGTAELVIAILAMARALRMDVVGEGIEHHEQVEFLSANGCTIGQGYHFSRPLSPEQVTERLQRASRRAFRPHSIGVPTLANAVSW